jgi:hypothetical protein
MNKNGTLNDDNLKADSVVSSSSEPSNATSVSVNTNFTTNGKHKHNTTKKAKLKNYMRSTFASMKKQNVKFQNDSLANFCTSLKYPINGKSVNLLKQTRQTNSNMIQQNSTPSLRMFNDWDGKREYEDNLNHFNNDDPSFGVDPYNHFG